MYKAVFLDLDGTLIRPASGAKFPIDKDDWELIPGITDILANYVDQGYYLLIVTNQGGIEAGHVKMNDFRYKIKRVINDIVVNTACPINRISYRFCVSNNRRDFFRKPNPGMAYDLASAYLLSLGECIMVGDASGLPGQFSDSDRKFADNAGIKTYYDISEFAGITTNA